ncbi:metal/formaldehyde-sensitive transcriptional repressor [Achromobacter sp. UMC71]|uniref:metal/formaldehyde-sensitive transcriptional repressor n=1 Tax=Achromobacter sp. UMC71 TaxID=1862320 RepID=UPI0015FF5FC6|nr:regulator [Achromobacter sp. UMC71]
MPHSPAEKKRVTTRLRRIQGQALALERAVNEGTECGALLQQLAALRGAATGLMAEVLESHLRETFLQSAQGGRPGAATIEPEAEIDQVMRIVRSYLK